ncbi:helix-hairpin-helix domain-containing protein [Dyadobacter sp. 676]|uniref:Helix-hairpin-helix domain-containing protein n=1 Tax=Dyadobacter sp. 676 TaxID=3088362 RepID=A0AAU8FSD2_9BACT
MKVLDSIAALLEKQQSAKPGRWQGRRSAPGDEAPSLTTTQIKPVDFNPNSASESELMGVGIPAFIARRIVKFRSRGGQFRRKEDLLKIYDFPPGLYTHLEKHIQIPRASPDAGTAAVPKSGAQVPERQITQDSKRIFDINQCDTTTLIRLKGIGSKLAQRILKFRDALGGFHSNEQLGEVYGLDPVALSELKRHASVITPVKKIQINIATIEEISRHPYLKNRKQVQILINYRQEHGPFGSLEDLRNAKALDDATLQKAKPYLSF